MNRSSISNPPTSFPTLLPCPFCEGEAIWRDDPEVCGIPFGILVHHKQGCCLNGLPFGKAEAVAAWNTRPQLQSSEAVERVARAITPLLRRVVDEVEPIPSAVDIARAAITALTSPTVDHCGIVEVNPEDFDPKAVHADEVEQRIAAILTDKTGVELSEAIVRRAYEHFQHHAEAPCSASAMREAIEMTLRTVLNTPANKQDKDENSG